MGRRNKRKAQGSNDSSLPAAEYKRARRIADPVPASGLGTPDTNANVDRSEAQSSDTLDSSHASGYRRNVGMTVAPRQDLQNLLPSTPSPAASTHMPSGQHGLNEPWLYAHTGIQVVTLYNASVKKLPGTSRITSTEEAVVLCSYNWSDDRRPTIFVPGKLASAGFMKSSLTCLGLLIFTDLF